MRTKTIGWIVATVLIVGALWAMVAGNKMPARPAVAASAAPRSLSTAQNPFDRLDAAKQAAQPSVIVIAPGSATDDTQQEARRVADELSMEIQKQTGDQADHMQRQADETKMAMDHPRDQLQQQARVDQVQQREYQEGMRAQALAAQRRTQQLQEEQSAMQAEKQAREEAQRTRGAGESRH